jgi:hypothetical protein
MLREDDLPKLNVPSAKESGAVKQIVFSHAVEPIAAFCFQSIPAIVEVLNQVIGVLNFSPDI